MSGWGSWLKGDAAATGGAAGPASSNFHAITDSFSQDALNGPLEPSDLEWTCAGGFTTETQTWYTVLDDGAFATSQIIHSAVGLWYPQVQMTFKYFNPATGKKIWKSVNVTKFVAPPNAGAQGPTGDKRSSKAAEFTVLFSTTDNGDDKYTITANLDAELQLSYSFVRPADTKGWKLGAGPKGGFSYFGSNLGSPDGYVIHRFWPVAESEGHIIHKGAAIEAKGRGMFVHAIQGMRPNLVAARWNFANFQAEDEKLGRVSAIMMEFTTTPDYGNPAPAAGGAAAGGDAATASSAREAVTVNIGSVVVNGKLVAVTGATRGSKAAASDPSKGSDSRVFHLNTTLDQDTGYQAPQQIKFQWEGPELSSSDKALVKANLEVDLGKPYPASETHGLVDKVDVLAEIPYMVRKLVNYVAGTKPYIYQTLNEVTLNLDFQGQQSQVKGHLFEEHTFISG
ncbi:oxidative stress survival, Svf1-like protein [Testicularia cyperi]|uniref:Oxidative stress survival, Svf1-like protein n=1 Tax=Testicularia cyperi TaxID=1882483 RepID=A0A317XGN7_9BASI|nr:oxidative stress survival, Svf1-like protein [Testicularia cyperi]